MSSHWNESESNTHYFKEKYFVFEWQSLCRSFSDTSPMPVNKYVAAKFNTALGYWQYKSLDENNSIAESKMSPIQKAIYAGDYG